MKKVILTAKEIDAVYEMTLFWFDVGKEFETWRHGRFRAADMIDLQRKMHEAGAR
jgi:hypothetical protein